MFAHVLVLNEDIAFCGGGRGRLGSASGMQMQFYVVRKNK